MYSENSFGVCVPVNSSANEIIVGMARASALQNSGSDHEARMSSSLPKLGGTLLLTPNGLRCAMRAVGTQGGGVSSGQSQLCGDRVTMWLQACESCSEASGVCCADSKRSSAVIIGSVVGAAAALVLMAGLAGLVLWVRRRRREESVRNLGDLGALPGAVSLSASGVRARPRCGQHVCSPAINVAGVRQQDFCNSSLAALAVTVVIGLLPCDSAGFTPASCDLFLPLRELQQEVHRA